jgi:hypothetical protein
MVTVLVAIHLPFTGERLTEKVREVLTVKPPSSPFDRPPDPWRNV